MPEPVQKPAFSEAVHESFQRQKFGATIGAKLIRVARGENVEFKINLLAPARGERFVVATTLGTVMRQSSSRGQRDHALIALLARPRR